MRASLKSRGEKDPDPHKMKSRELRRHTREPWRLSMDSLKIILCIKRPILTQISIRMNS
jgi:hypothetical protein